VIYIEYKKYPSSQFWDEGQNNTSAVPPGFLPNAGTHIKPVHVLSVNRILDNGG
jgi:hypothetical protein